MEFLLNYGLFLAKAVTVVLAIGAVLLLVIGLRQRQRRRQGELQIQDLGKHYREMRREMQLARMGEAEQRIWHKRFKKQEKQDAKLARARARQGDGAAGKSCLYVLDFKGSMDAGEVSSLREEISAVLAVARPEDEVLLRLESPGGVVHGYGLAASQLQRLREHGIRLTVAVDKVAASGGYMMACVADRIIAAPFAILGSIGVVAQIPNFNRLLKRNDIDIELHTAGAYKRTLTLFGENSEQGREKFRQDLNETHQLFKRFVQDMRPTLNIDAVATGEHWYGSQARELGLIDAIGTSDELLIAEMADHEVIGIKYTRRKRLLSRFTDSAALSIEGRLLHWWQRSQKPLL
ncbi:protease SohB [Martelella alba]|uniref:Protease SohB n=1 Tax=Martelella alba TaxID=2590451 RepID=A0ABY2SRS1_9HYPH|nr:protease SohB [Martelella alba]TKI08120.1 protease SohB [Martelella alba]